MNDILLEIAITSSAIVGGIVFYIRWLKKKMKRFVLRNDEIEKYFKEGQE